MQTARQFERGANAANALCIQRLLMIDSASSKVSRSKMTYGAAGTSRLGNMQL